MNQRRNPVDDFLHHLADEYAAEIVWAMLMLIALVMRLEIIPRMQSDDYYMFLEPWCKTFASMSFREGMAVEVTNYYVPYTLLLNVIAHLPLPYYILICLTSCFFDFITAFFVIKLVRFLLQGGKQEFTLINLSSPEALSGAYLSEEEIRNRAGICGMALLFLPFVFLNSAVWGQCDSIYTAFAIMSLTYLLQGKNHKAFLLFGVALSFKLQAIFFLPFFLYYYFAKKRCSILHFLYIPAVYLAAGLPAIFCGRSPLDTYLVYRLQVTHDTDSVTRHMPNLYSFGLADYYVLKTAGILIAAAVFFAAFLWVLKGRERLDLKNLMLLCLWTLLTAVMFLPGMHERYDYPFSLLLSVYALAYREKKILLCALLVNLIDLMTYCSFLFYTTLLPPDLLVLPYLFVYLQVTLKLRHVLLDREV